MLARAVQAKGRASSLVASLVSRDIVAWDVRGYCMATPECLWRRGPRGHTLGGKPSLPPVV